MKPYASYQINSILDNTVNRYFKTGFTVRSVVVSLKDPGDMEEQCGVIYGCECDIDVCGEVYVGETERSLEQRAEELAKSIEKGVSKSALSER